MVENGDFTHEQWIWVCRFIAILMGKLMTSYCNGFCGIGVPYFQTAPYRLFHNGTEHVGSNMEEVRQIIGVQNRHEKTVGICIIYIYGNDI